MTDFPVSALRSAEIDVPDLGAAERFYTEVWGLALAERAEDTLYLRATGDDHHVLALRQGSPALRSITFRAADAEALAGFASGGVGKVLRPAGPMEEPGGGIGLVMEDPRGLVLRVVHGDARRAPEAPVRDRPERLAHLNVNSTDADATAAFFEAALGFRLSDRSNLMAFVRCNADHHAVVIADAPVDGLNHIAFLLPSLEGVMLASGRMVAHGYPIGWGVGRHGPGDNVFAYFQDPFGLVIEHTSEVLQIDDDYVLRPRDAWNWPPGRIDHWGIAPPKSDAMKKAQLATPFAAWR